MDAADAADTWQIDEQEVWVETHGRCESWISRTAPTEDLGQLSKRRSRAQSLPGPSRTSNASRKPTTNTLGMTTTRTTNTIQKRRHCQGRPEQPLQKGLGKAKASRAIKLLPLPSSNNVSTAQWHVRLVWCKDYQLLKAAPMQTDLHPRSKTGDMHALTAPGLRNRLREQLARTRDEDCENLEINIARSLLFKLCITSHGYTLVGKGTIARFVLHLRHEGKMYHRLCNLQGRLVSDCFGNIDLVSPWYGSRLHIVHMLPLSYRGEELMVSSDRERQQAKSFETTIAALSVRHADVGCSNMLWNEKLERTVLIDFERSTLMDTIPSTLSRASLLRHDVIQDPMEINS
ncbi:MAG: hypothetical protein Q9184_005868 [Pyrenodesmia sp. 2 TL-2023]